MPKRKTKQSLVSPFLLFLILIVIIGFAGIAGGFYYLSNSSDFAPDPSLTMPQFDPDATQLPASTRAITPNNTNSTETFQVLLNDLNAVRVDAGLSPLRLNTTLSRAAAQQVTYTAINNNLVHEDANGTLVDARVDALGYMWVNLGENLLRNWTLDGTAVFTQWQDSPSHNANMMNPDFTEIGLAYYVTSFGQVYHGMVLARPDA